MIDQPRHIADQLPTNRAYIWLNVAVYRFDLDSADVWLSETNPVSFAFQIARANLTHREPDVGVSAPVELSGAAPA